MNFDRREQEMQKQRNIKRRTPRRARPYRSLEALERRELLAVDVGASPYHNSANPRDVNHDNRVTPFDALLVINDLSRHGMRSLSDPMASPLAATGTAGSTSALDVNGDGRISPADALKVINLLAVDKLVQVTTIPTDLGGNPITSISAGSDFLLQTTVTDVRVPTSSFPGVFAAYMNVNYDSALASISPSATFNFDPFFSVARTFDISSPGLISGAGASAASFTAPGNAPQKMWTVLVHASAGGVVTFTPSFDSAPGHETLLYGNDDAIAADAIDYVGASLQITETPTLSVANASVVEGNSGTTNMVFTVSLSNVFNQDVTVQFATATPGAGNVATAGVDYQSTSGTLTFAANETTKLVTVTVQGDTTVEPDEIFNLALSNPTNSILGTNSTATGTITNDDFVSSFTIGDVTVTNVTSGTIDAVFTVTLSPAPAVITTVQFATSNGTATAGSDYTATSGTLTFNPGVASQTITVSVIGNAAPAVTENFLVTLTNPTGSAVLSDGQAVGTIQPAVILPNLSINNVSLAEGNSGTTPFVFTATLSSPAPSQLLVGFSTANGSATTAGNDYVGTSGTLTFAPGQTTALITVAVNGDTTTESNETFVVNLSAISGPVGTVQTPATATILNDDGTPTFTINDVTIVGGASGLSNAVFTVNLSLPVSQLVTVSYATQDNTAVANEDYLAQSGILTFAPGGPQQQTITVPVVGSAVPVPDETFFVNLSSVSEGAAIGDSQAVGTIIRQGISISNPTVLEGNSGNTAAVFTVSLSQAQDHQVTVAYATANGTATTVNNDYQSTSGVLTFVAGETAKFITVPIVGDTTVEPNENFFVNLSNSTGLAIFSGQGTGTIINDDGQKALIQLVLADSSGTELPPNSTLEVNENFLLQVYVQDIQANPTGIAAAYLDILYTSTLVSVNGPIIFSPNFPNIQSGNTGTPGLIDEAGAFGDLAPPAQPGNRQLLFSVPLRAIDVGLANFLADPADAAEHQVLEYTNDEPIPPAAINFVNASVNVGTNVVSVNNVTKAEGNSGTTDFVFTVTRFLATAETATVVYSTANGSATSGSDYIAQSGTLTFNIGDTTKLITISVVGDSTDENDETFFVNLSNPVGVAASQSPGTGTITNDDSPVSVSIGAASASEGGTLSFPVTLSAVSGKTVTVAYTTASALSGNLATAGLDYAATSGTVTFAPGQTSATITVQALEDLLVESSEVFRVVLSSPSNATLGAASGTGTILDVPPAIITGMVFADLNNNGVKDGNEAGIEGATVTATRVGTGVIQSAVTDANGVYTLLGLQPGTYTLKELQPGFFNDGRDFRLGIESPTNDQYDNIVLAPSGVASGYNFGEKGLRSEFVNIFLNNRAFFASSIVTNHWGPTTSTSNLDLRRGDAWIAIDGGWQGLRALQAMFNPANGTATMTLYNSAVQPIAVSLPNGQGAVISYSGNLGTSYFLKISGNNPNVSLQSIDTVTVSNVSQFEGTGGTTSFVFTASLSTPQSQQVTVNYGTADGTASAAAGDYLVANGIITFAPGQTQKTVTITVSGDAGNETDETFSLILSNPTNIAIGTPAAVGTILNDDGITINGSSLFASGGGSSGGSAAPAAAPAVAPAATPAVQTSSQPADAPLAATPTATDSALEEDEDWVTTALLA